MPTIHETPASKKTLTQTVYEGVTEQRRATVVGILWMSGAIKVDVVKESDGTYTITATFEADTPATD